MAEYIVKETLQAKLNRKKAEPANKRYTEGWNDAILPQLRRKDGFGGMTDG